MRVFGVFLSLDGLLFILCERKKFYYFLERAEGGATQNQIERIIERIDGVLSESEQFGTEEGKRKILKKFQEVLSDFPTDGQDRKK